MSLQLITPPTEEPVTLADMKAHLRIVHDDEDDAIEAYARSARRAVEARGGLALCAQVWRLTLDKWPQGILTLPRAPVFSIDTVTVIDRDGIATSVDPALYDLQTGTLGRLIARGTWPHTARLIGGVRVDFTAGWASPADTPEELKLAVKMLAAHFFENREGAAADRIFSTPQAVDALIAPYRQMRL
ncbi:MAG: head-tail connector protein [Amphiplicatus sp.]